MNKMIKVVSVKFKNGGKPYYFAPNAKETYEKGAGVIVETAKGLEYATVVQPECEVEDSEIVTPLKPVVRVATERDKEQVKRNRERRGEAIRTAKEKIAARGLEMKVIDCEFAFDGTKVVFYFTSENRVDFRELIKDLSSAFHMRIELRQINIRDEIKLTGGLAPCGRECCCAGCMSEPKKVSVKMAKNQGLSLNPSKISGLCGRLMCCLSYENDYYAEACKVVPKLGSEVETPKGKGMVVNVNMLKMQCKVKIEQNDAVSYHDFGVDEIRFMRGNVVMGNENLGEEEEPADEDNAQPEAVQQPAAEKNDGNERRGNNKNRDRRGKDGQSGNKNRENRENKDNRGNSGNNAQPRRDNNGGNGNRNGNNKNRDKGNNNRGGAPEQKNAGKDGGVKPEGNKKRRHRNRREERGQEQGGAAPAPDGNGG